MLTLAWPWLLTVLPLPWLVRWLLRPARNAPAAAARVPFFAESRVIDDSVAGLTHTRNLDAILTVSAWILLVLAACKPQYVGDALEMPISGRDLVIAVDISGSMEQDDFTIADRRATRLDVVKLVASEFVERREGDRLGLVLFGARAYLQTPLTFDRDAVVAMLYEAEIGLAGKLTAVGDAIGLSLKRMREAHSNERVLVLMTDGANTAGQVSPKLAAQLAAREGLRIYTIGIGAERRFNTLFGIYELAASGDLDEESLKVIADTTGGRYFRAANTDDLKQIYADLDRLEPVVGTDTVLRPTLSLFPWPLAGALALTVLPALRRVAWPKLGVAGD